LQINQSFAKLLGFINIGVDASSEFSSSQHCSQLNGAAMPQDFQGKNLKKEIFLNRQIPRAIFSGVDIRGIDFSGANLAGADFSRAIGGLSAKALTILSTFTIFLALLSGLTTAYSGALLGRIFIAPDPTSLILAQSIAIILILFFLITLKKGLGFSLGLTSLITATVIVLTVAITPSPDIAGKTALSSLIIGGTIAGVVGLATSFSLSHFKKLIITVTILGVILGSLLGLSEDAAIPEGLGVVLVSTIVLLLARYIGKRALKEDDRYRLITNLTTSLSTLGGTRFCGADLSNADFSGATLSGTDFRRANLSHVYWQNAQLDRANLERTYLEKPLIRKLLTLNNGEKGNLQNLDLRDVNLKEYNLKDADLSGTDLSNAILQGSDLSGSNLSQSKLYKADLTGACLTGVYIQDWGISPDITLDNIECDYIYMRRPTDDDPDVCRKPDRSNDNFQPGDFADFIEPIKKVLSFYRKEDIDPRQIDIQLRTLDLTHHSGIDPTAAAIAITQLAEAHPEAKLSLATLEGRGTEKIRLQVTVDAHSDRPELSREYFYRYNKAESLPRSESQELLAIIAEKSHQVLTLEKLLESAIKQPKFHIETSNYQGEITMTESKGNVTIIGAQGDISGVTAAGESLSITGSVIGAISGNVMNSIGQLPNSPNSDEPGIKELLTELQAAIEADPSLDEEDKAEALKQIKEIAEGGKQPKDNAVQKTVKTAMKILKGTIADLPSTEELVKVSLKILPLIAKFFGLP
jgi:uncharacterized protein YjbI with pentapeptide repeats